MKHSSVSVSGGGSIPEPFNLNDVTIWSDLICKYACQNLETSFDYLDFLREVIDDKIMPLNAYNKELMKRAEQGEKNEFYEIINYCLNFLQLGQLLTKMQYPTERLSAICPKVNQILMPGVRSLVEAEEEILNDPNFLDIFDLLKKLEKGGKLNRLDVTNLVTNLGFRKLIKLNIIILYLDERVEITTLGKLTLTLLERNTVAS